MKEIAREIHMRKKHEKEFYLRNAAVPLA